MTKGEFVESIYINISSGKLSDDIHLQRVDISTYLPVAINWAIQKKHREDKRDARMDGIINNNVSADLTYTYHIEDIKKDCKRGLDYVDLPVPIQALDNNRGIVSMFPTKGGESFRKVGGPNHFQYLDRVYGGVTLFWYEQSTEGDRIYIKNLSPSVTSVNVQLVPSIGDLSDEDTLPIPAGYELDIMNLCIQYFRQQRLGPVNYDPDNKDDKKQ